jgi:hypothetical protein
VLAVPDSIPFAQWQLLTQPAGYGTLLTGAGEFGYSVAMSLDERWMYIGAPGLNSVHAYGYHDWQNQVIKVTGDGVTLVYTIDDTIQINNDYQLKVTLNGQIKTVVTDYTIDASFSTVTFLTTPGVTTAGSFVPGQSYTILSVGTTDFVAIGASANTVGVEFIATGAGIGTGTALEPTLIEFSRYNSFQRPYTAVTYNLDDDINNDGNRVGLFTATDIYSFSINLNGDLLRPNIDYTFAGTTVTFIVALTSIDIVVVNAKGYFEYVATIDSSSVTGGLTAGDRFGQSVSCSTDGRQVLIGTSNRTIDGEVEAGTIYVFERNVQRFICATTATNTNFTVLGGTPTAPVSVIVNNVFYINETDSVIGADNSFTTNAAVVTVAGTLQVGDVVEIETNQFQQQQQVDGALQRCDLPPDRLVCPLSLVQ